MINYIEYLRFYGIEKDFGNAGIFQTDKSKLLTDGMAHSIRNGRLTVLTGLVGSGKTTTVKVLKTILSPQFIKYTAVKPNICHLVK